MNADDFSDISQCLIVRCVVAFLAISTLAGCGGSDRAAVSGTLLQQDGTPLVGARVIARSNETGKSAYGQTNGQGYFELGGESAGDGIPPGDYYVTVVEDIGDENNPRPQTISSKYRNPSTSGLTLSVKAGQKAVLDAKLDRR
jgi:hypothetical protein